MAADDARPVTRAARRRLGLAGEREEEGGFLARWSRRKDAARAGALAEEDLADPGDLAARDGAAAQADAQGVGGGADAADRESIRPEDLPDPDTLTAESDFSVFMREGVPPDLQRRALRKLWLTDPALANLDGLLDYGGDFSQVGKTKMVIKTAWQVGKGYLAALDAEGTAKTAAGREDGPDAPPQAVTGGDAAADEATAVADAGEEERGAREESAGDDSRRDPDPPARG